MSYKIVTGILFTLAVLNVLLDRLIFPALVIAFRAIESSFAPPEPAPQLALVAATEPVIAVAAEPPIVKAPRPARRRKPSKKLLAKIEAIA